MNHCKDSIPASAKTVISPNVSNPLKSTKITFTTFVPPPPLTEFSIKKSAIVKYSLLKTAKVKIKTATATKIDIIKSLEILDLKTLLGSCLRKRV